MLVDDVDAAVVRSQAEETSLPKSMSWCEFDGCCFVRFDLFRFYFILSVSLWSLRSLLEPEVPFFACGRTTAAPTSWTNV
jgi:hypothetical protein